MPKWLGKKNGIVYLSLAAIVLITMCVFLSVAISQKLYNNERTNMFAKANIISGAAANPADHNIEDFIAKSLAGTQTRGILLDSAGKALYDTNISDTADSFIFTGSVISHALAGGQESVVYKSRHGIKTLSVAVPVMNNNIVTGAVLLSRDMSSADSIIGFARLCLICFCIIIIILTVVLGIKMSRIVTSPLGEFVSAAQEISKGNFHNKLPVKGTSQIDQLANAMNYMCSELELLETKRRKFVSDASHELKTPMATIKLICDSITASENPDMAMVQDFLSDLSDEVDRLTRIIEKLLLLTKMDSKEIQFSPELSDFGMMLQRIKNKLTPMAVSKNIILSAEAQPDIPPVMMDYDRIWESVYNVVDNAIKYSKIGGTVRITAEASDNQLTVRVYDSGKGIPDEHKEHIFERFYRLDDSRARETGGTGLGLAIAKEALLLHGGSICVEDNPEGGSCFIITLPITNQSGGEV